MWTASLSNCPCKHIREEKITLAIDPKKDVDGFHPVNFGRMAQGLPAYLPATPFGILEMLRRYNIETAGKHAVIVGRSNIVGTPMSILLSRKGYPGDCALTLAHSRTKNLTEETLRADILVAAIGSPHFIKEDMVKPGAVVIDVGMNRIDDPSKKSGTRLVGDVDFEAVARQCNISPPCRAGGAKANADCFDEHDEGGEGRDFWQKTGSARAPPDRKSRLILPMKKRSLATKIQSMRLLMLAAFLLTGTLQAQRLNKYWIEFNDKNNSPFFPPPTRRVPLRPLPPTPRKGGHPARRNRPAGQPWISQRADFQRFEAAWVFSLAQRRGRHRRLERHQTG